MMSSGRTGTRWSSRPVALRSAEATAAVDTTVGGSPMPFASQPTVHRPASDDCHVQLIDVTSGP